MSDPRVMYVETRGERIAREARLTAWQASVEARAAECVVERAALAVAVERRAVAREATKQRAETRVEAQRR